MCKYTTSYGQISVITLNIWSLSFVVWLDKASSRTARLNQNRSWKTWKLVTKQTGTLLITLSTLKYIYLFMTTKILVITSLNNILWRKFKVTCKTHMFLSFTNRRHNCTQYCRQSCKHTARAVIKAPPGTAARHHARLFTITAFITLEAFTYEVLV